MLARLGGTHKIIKKHFRGCSLERLGHTAVCCSLVDRAVLFLEGLEVLILTYFAANEIAS